MMQLGLIGCLPARATRLRSTILVQYLLYKLNLNKCYDYVDYFNLKGVKRTNDANLLLKVVEGRMRGKLKNKVFRNKFAEQIIIDWRNGLFGKNIIF